MKNDPIKNKLVKNLVDAGNHLKDAQAIFENLPPMQTTRPEFRGFPMFLEFAINYTQKCVDGFKEQPEEILCPIPYN